MSDLLAPLRALIEHWQQLSDQKETRCREIEGDDWDIVDGAEDAMRLGGCSRQLAALLPVLAAQIDYLQAERRNYFEAHLQAALRAEAEIASKVIRRAEAAESALADRQRGIDGLSAEVQVLRIACDSKDAEIGKLQDALSATEAKLAMYESRSPDGDGPCMRSDTRQHQTVPSHESEDRSVKGAPSGVVSGAGSEPADSHLGEILLGHLEWPHS